MRKNDIIKWLKEHQVKGYELIPDAQYGYVVNVNRDVDLSKRKLTKIPVKFNIVRGYFNCSENELISLEGSPNEVLFDFYAHVNCLTSLEHCPHKVGGEFYCNTNKITSLEFCPSFVRQDFICHNNPCLGTTQKITNFKLIYEEYLNIKEKKDLFDSLNNQLNSKDNIKKIKI